MVKPNSGKNRNVPTSDTGTASNGISVARQPCRKMYTTRITRTIAISSVSTISFIPSLTARVVSIGISVVHVVGETGFGFRDQLLHALRPPQPHWTPATGRAQSRRSAFRSDARVTL